MKIEFASWKKAIEKNCDKIEVIESSVKALEFNSVNAAMKSYG